MDDFKIMATRKQHFIDLLNFDSFNMMLQKRYQKNKEQVYKPTCIWTLFNPNPSRDYWK